MGIFDAIVLAVFIISIVIGLVRGFFKESLSIISWILAIWLGFAFYSQAGDFIHQYFEVPAKVFRDTVGFIAVFVVALICSSLINYLIAKILSAKALKEADRVLGALFGAVRATLIMTAILIIAKGLAMNSSDWWKESLYIEKTQSIVEYVESLLPENWRAPSKEDIVQKATQTVLEEK